MNTSLLRATTKDKLMLSGVLYEPEQSTTVAVLHIHGMTGDFYDNYFLDKMAKSYTDAKVSLLSVNTRGHGSISDIQVASDKQSWRRIGNAHEIFKDSKLDIETWLQELLNRGYTKIYLQGHSLGASKVVYFQAEEQNTQVAGLILLSATEMIHYPESNPGHLSSLKEAKELVSAGKGSQLLTAPIWEDKFIVSANTYIDFTTRGNPIDVFKGYDKTLEAPIGQITVPILAVMGKKDNGPKLIGETAEEYMELLKSKSKKCPDFQYFVPDTTHGYFEHEEEVAKHVTNWLRKTQ